MEGERERENVKATFGLLLCETSAAALISLFTSPMSNFIGSLPTTLEYGFKISLQSVLFREHVCLAPSRFPSHTGKTRCLRSHWFIHPNKKRGAPKSPAL